MTQKNGSDAEDASELEAIARSPWWGRGMLIVLVVTTGIGAGIALTSNYYPAVDRAIQWAGAKIEVLLRPEDPSRYEQFTELQDLVVNPRGSQGRRYLQVSLGLESHSSQALEEVRAHQVVARDTILAIFGGYSTKELAAVETWGKVKGEILRVLNGLVSEGRIRRVYFTEYVLK